jgi:hypothetical protein
MELLDPKKIEKEKNEELEKRRKLVAEIGEEESRIVRKLNDARDLEVAEETRRINDHEAFKARIGAECDELTREVASLEKRKVEALRPAVAALNEALAEAKATTEQAKKDIEAASVREQAVATREDTLLERIEDLTERKDELDEQEEKIIIAEQKVKDEQELSKRSAQRLMAEWTKLHEQTAAANADLARRETDMVGANLAHIARAKSLDEKEKNLLAHDRVIRDKYKALESATKELTNR